MNRIQSPYRFDDFFASGKEESISPFLTRGSRSFGKNLSLKIASCSFFLLLTAYGVRAFYPDLGDLLLIFVYLFVGTPALIDAIEDIKNLQINIDVLMTLAALLSVVIGSSYEGAMLLVLFELSAAMENAALQKTKGSLTYLHELSPSRAFLVKQDGSIVERSCKDIQAGAHILVKAGEIVPLDGQVIQGLSTVTLAHLTGESIPVTKATGDDVAAGARNLEGTLTLKVTRTSSDSTLARIIDLITQAQEAKPKIQKLIDKLGDRYALSVMTLSALFAIALPWLSLDLPYFGKEGSIYRALSFLIAASPCALVLATPTAYLSAISSSAKKGILLKGGAVLDALARCKAIAFDKTGTLTEGTLGRLLFKNIAGSLSYDEGLAAAASLEKNVVHPIAHAITLAAREKGLPYFPVEHFQSHPGSGVSGTVTMHGRPCKVIIGNLAFVYDFLSDEVQKQAENLSIKDSIGQVAAFVLIDDSLFYATASDEIKTDAASIVSCLKKEQKMQLYMLTGDQKTNACAVAEAVGIDNIYAQLKPKDKLDIVAKLSKDQGLIMIGDGVNDAPALVRATVGISMGKIGSATAVDASDVVLLHDELQSIGWLLKKAKKTTRIIKQNLILALCVIFFATTPALLGLVPLWLAVILHEGGTVLVGLNSLRLLRS